MRPIYKSVVLESAILAVSLSLQAEVNDGSDVTTVGVDASTLDGLRVELASPKVSGALDLIASGAAVVSGSTISVTLGGFEELATLEQVTYRLTVKARYGTQVRTLYALDITVPRGTLAGGAQEYEDSFAVVSTFGDGGGEFPDDYARQGDNPNATNTAIMSKVNEITSLDADLIAGKIHLATSITAMGVPSSSADSLSAMAAKVLQIPHELNTGVSDFEQVIAPQPYIWNVYSVAQDLMKDELAAYIPEYMSTYKLRYGTNAFFVGEYYLGYTSLELTGADGYLTCDGDFYTISDGTVTHTLPDGTVETYASEAIIHTWHDGDSGRCNRWVAFFYLTDGYAFANSTSSICPRRVAICGLCSSFAIQNENRLTDVWVIGELGTLEGGTTGSKWNPAQVIRNYVEHSSSTPIYSARILTSLIMPDIVSISGAIFSAGNASLIAFAEYLLLPELTTLQGRALILTSGTSTYSSRLAYLGLPKLKTCKVPIISSDSNNATNVLSLSEISLPAIEELNVTGNPGGYGSHAALFVNGYTSDFGSVKRLDLHSLKRQISGRLFIYNTASGYVSWVNLIDIEVGEMTTSLNISLWNPTAVLADVSPKAQLVDNIKNHILDHVSDATGGTQLVFTVSTNMYNAISGENITWQDQTMTLADAFLTKNWLLAGA